MSLPRTVAEILREHVTLEVEGIDRMYLNAYVPGLQYEGGVAAFFRRHRGQPFASSALMEPISKAFVAAIHGFVQEHGVPLITFEKGQRKDDVMAEHLKRFPAPEGVVFVGRAQEKTPVFRTEKRRNPTTGQAYPWLVRSTAMINHFYFYAVDQDFGPFFLKFATYFPYNAKLCLNGHEYLKRQLARRGIPFEPLDNGLLWCDDPRRAQALCEGLSAEKIEAFARKWLRRLPVWDRPLSGRVFFEEVIRENLDVGRPDQVQLIFDRRVSRRTPGRFRTLLPEGFTARDLRQHVAPLLGLPPAALSAGRVTYDLRRLRLHGLIEREPHRHRYRVTDAGLRLALFVPRVWARTLRPGLATVMPGVAPNDGPLRRAFERLEQAMDDWCEAKVVA